MTSPQDLSTPVVLVDMDIVERNIAAAQAQFDALGIAFRPHVKTHKIPDLAKMQVAAGAKGIACQKISEAEVFAEAGIDDILLCFNLLDAEKIARIRRLHETALVRVVADNALVVKRLSQGFAHSPRPLGVLVECDTGLARCGVQTPESACALAREIDTSKGLEFAGLMTYPAPENNARVEDFMTCARALCLGALGHCEMISSGGTPSMADAGEAPIVTEYRAGTYIYNDRSLVERGSCGIADCALWVLATVVSRPIDNRAIIDAGSKSLSSDLLGLEGFGLLPDYPGASVIALSEEHGHLDFSGCVTRPEIGEKIRIIPNHACPVSNLVDQVVFHRNGSGIEHVQVAARGCII